MDNNTGNYSDETASFGYTLADDEWQEFISKGIPFTIYLSILLVLGTVGNITAIVIFSIRKPPSNCRTFILWLSVVGLLSCVIGIPEYIFKERRKFSYRSDPVCKVFVFIHYFLSSYCVLILDLIAVERYMKTCKMFGRQLSRKAAKLTCVGLGFVALAIAIYPTLYVYGVEKVVGKLSKQVGYKCTLPDVAKGEIFFGVFGFLNIFGIVFSVTFYALIYRMLKLHKKENKELLKMAPKPLKNRGSRENVSASQSSLNRVRDFIKGTRTKVKSSSVDEIHRLMMKYDSKTSNAFQLQQNGSQKINCDDNDSDDIFDEHDQDGHDSRSPESVSNQAISGGRTAAPKSRSVSKLSIISTSDIMMQRIKTLNKSVKMTLVFFVATVSSYLTAIPYIVCMCIASVNAMLFYRILEALRPFTYIFLYLHLLNYVINPFVYCVLDGDFRKELKLLYRQGLKKKKFLTESTSC